MLNKSPIVINGFGRGGTNILMNLLLSHPSLAMPSGELNKVIKGGAMGEKRIKKIYKKLFYDMVIRLLAGDIFDRFNFKKRDKISYFVKVYVDRILWQEKQRARHESHNKWKNEAEHYTADELRKARLVLKAHNGLIFMNDMFRSMYPEVRFVVIVRNGYAVCESLIRRGWRLEEAARLYDLVGREILANKQKNDCLLVKFEDVLIDPLDLIEKIYSHCKLDSSACAKFRLQHKSFASKDSDESILQGEYDRQVVWFNRNELVTYFKPDVNTNQIRRLSSEQIANIERIAGETISRLGYKNDYLS